MDSQWSIEQWKAEFLALIRGDEERAFSEMPDPIQYLNGLFSNQPDPLLAKAFFQVALVFGVMELKGSSFWYYPARLRDLILAFRPELQEWVVSELQHDAIKDLFSRPKAGLSETDVRLWRAADKARAAARDLQKAIEMPHSAQKKHLVRSGRELLESALSEVASLQ